MVDKRQANFLADKLDRAIAGQPAWRQLADHLTAIGGEYIVARHEEYLDELLTRGEDRWGVVAHIVKGRSRDCHGNSARMYLRDRRHTIWTGWAESADGVWRQHSWCELDGRIIETTEPRTMYYGFKLTPAESDIFVKENT